MANLTGISAFKCDICEKVFSKQYYLYKHCRRVHKIEPDIKKTLLCPVTDCQVKNRSFQELREHISNTHCISIDSETLTFPSLPDFNTWKEDMEKTSKCCYIIIKTTRLADESLKQYFWCNRSGDSKCSSSSNEMKRAPRAKGSRKIDSHCPSTLEVIQEKDDIKVTFHKTHVGHDLELRHLPINKSDKESLAMKIADGIPLDRCLDDIKSSLTGPLEKIHSVMRKDLWNIGNSYQLFNKERLNSEDGVSLDMWVQEMNKLGENSPVLFYKPHGEHLESLLDDDFCIILMTVAQKEMLSKFGNSKICIDSTHETNPYHYLLTTLLVIDEFNAGFPVAFCISTTTHTKQMKIFFNAIREKTSVFTPDVFMSDDASAFSNAWKDVMGEPKKQLLCSWHIDKNWRQALFKIKNKDKRTEVYKFAKTLQEELNIDDFNSMLERFLDDLKADEDTTDFHEYFLNHYAKRCHLWAYCHRLNSGINNNMHMEAFHKVLKHIYMNGRKCQRMDTFISLLMKYIRDRVFSRFQKLVNGASCGKIAEINSRHRKSQNINPETISKIDSEKWEVESEENKDVKYTVIKEISICKKCNLFCSYCKMCIHMYSCTCVDAHIKMNMCKHIHAVHRCSANQESEPKVGEKIILDEIQNSVSFQSLIEENKKIEDNLWRLKISHMNELLNNDLNDETKRKIMKHIDDIIKLAVKPNITDQDKSNEPANKKIQVQRRLYSTRKIRCVKPNSIKKPSVSCKVAIKDSVKTKQDILHVHDAFDHTY